MAVTGVEGVIRAIGKSRTEHGIKIAAGLELAMEAAFQLSQIYVPVKTKELKKSGRIEITGVGFAARGRIVYGRKDIRYTIYVHEDLFARHKPPTRAKFLEDAIRETKEMQERLVNRVVKSNMRDIRIDTRGRIIRRGEFWEEE